MRKILILAANPKNTARLRLDEEVREIEEGLLRAQRRDEFEVRSCWAARPLDLRRKMLEIAPDIVHFCGHGDESEGIALENFEGQKQSVSADALADFFKLFSEQVECVILNACYTAPQAKAIARHIPYVIGMKQAIGDHAAREFSIALYDALGAGKSLEFAYESACNAIHLAGLPDYLTPMLQKRSKIAAALLAAADSGDPLLDAVADALCRRGVVPLFDPSLSSNDEADFIGEMQRAASEPGAIERAEILAESIARRVYASLGFYDARNVAIVLDQRGVGSGKAPYSLPAQFPELVNYPTFVFRPDTSAKTESNTATAAQWQRIAQTMRDSLMTSIGTLRAELHIHILGNAQLGLPYFLGCYFNRLTFVTLSCYHSGLNLVFSNREWNRLHGGKAPDVTEIEAPDAALAPLPEQTALLFVGFKYALKDVEDFSLAVSPSLPVETLLVGSGDLAASDDVLRLIQQVLTRLYRLRRQNVLTIRLICALPFNVMPLLAASLVNVGVTVEYFEFRKDSKERGCLPAELYTELPLRFAAQS